MLSRVLSGIGMVLGSIVILGVTWIGMSAIAFVGTSLLLIAFPSMETGEMIDISMVYGGVGVVIALMAQHLDKRGHSA